MQLFPYQTEMLERGRAEIRAGRRRFIFNAMMGAGKTVLSSEMIRSAVEKGSHCLFVAHRRELVNQASSKLDTFGVEHGIIMSGSSRARSGVGVQVASVQTLQSKVKRSHSWREYMRRFQLVVADECHHFPNQQYLDVLAACAPDVVLAGLTATPERLDGKPLGGGLFQSIVPGPPARNLIDMGALVPINGFSFRSPDLRAVAKKRGDYDPKQLDGVVREVVIGGDVIRDYLEAARGKRAICFALNTDISRALVEEANRAGIPAVHVDYETPKEERDAILHPTRGRLATGEVLWVGNCTLLTEGTDIPSVEVIITTRPTCSLTLALQTIGRGMRPWCFTCSDRTTELCRASGHHFKTACLVHDHAGILSSRAIGPRLCAALGITDGVVEFSLTDEVDAKAEKWSAARAAICPGCNLACKTTDVKCPSCGKTLKVDGAAGVLFQQNDDLERISIDDLKDMLPLDAPSYTDRDLARIALATREQKAQEYLRLRSLVDRGRIKSGAQDYLYRSTFGVFPKFSDAELAGVEPARNPFIPLNRRK